MPIAASASRFACLQDDDSADWKAPKVKTKPKKEETKKGSKCTTFASKTRQLGTLVRLGWTRVIKMDSDGLGWTRVIIMDSDAGTRFDSFHFVENMIHFALSQMGKAKSISRMG